MADKMYAVLVCCLVALLPDGVTSHSISKRQAVSCINHGNYGKDENFCNRFIRCVYNVEKHFCCPRGTVWSQALVTCVHINSNIHSNCKFTGICESTAVTPTTEAGSCNANGAISKDPQFCNRQLQCVNGKNKPVCCPRGTVWSQDSGSCVNIDGSHSRCNFSNECGTTTVTSTTGDKSNDPANSGTAAGTAGKTADETADETAVGTAGETADGTAGQTAGQTADGTAGKTAGQTADETPGKTPGETPGGNAGGTTGGTAAVSCTVEGEFFEDLEFCNRYLRCASMIKIPVCCSPATVWSQKLSTCVHPESNQLGCRYSDDCKIKPVTPTTEAGSCIDYGKDEDFCNRFIRCENGMKTHVCCPRGTVWLQDNVRTCENINSNRHSNCNFTEDCGSTPVIPTTEEEVGDTNDDEAKKAEEPLEPAADSNTLSISVPDGSVQVGTSKTDWDDRANYIRDITTEILKLCNQGFIGTGPCSRKYYKCTGNKAVSLKLCAPNDLWDNTTHKCVSSSLLTCDSPPAEAPVIDANAGRTDGGTGAGTAVTGEDPGRPVP